MPQNPKITKLVAVLAVPLPSELYGVGFGNTLMDVIPGVVLINQKKQLLQNYQNWGNFLHLWLYGWIGSCYTFGMCDGCFFGTMAHCTRTHMYIPAVSTCHLQQPQVSSQSLRHMWVSYHYWWWCLSASATQSMCTIFLLQPNSCSLTGLIRSNCWEIGGQRNPALFFKEDI